MTIRYELSVDDGWRMAVRCEGVVLATRELRRVEVPQAPGTFVPVSPEMALGAAADEAGRLAGLASKLASRDYGADAVRSMGRGLFDNFMGGDVWRKIVADACGRNAGRMELALSWREQDRDLHRLNWELMCHGDRYLAEGVMRADGVRVPLAVTRLVSTAAFGARVLSVPTRVLFAVGCSLEDPQVAPGAEYMALMRQLERIDPLGVRMPVLRVLANATPTRLREVVAEFRPDVVLVVAHGSDEGGEVRLEFRPDRDAAPGSHRLGVVGLAEALSWEEQGQGRLPGIVVLSACFAGAVDDFGAGDPFAEAGGAGGVGGMERRRGVCRPASPLAAGLVARGVPVVVGMGGRISDRACRLFTQFFCSSIVEGRELVESVERGRRGAFWQGEDPGRSHDWALPVLFMARGVTADHRPTPPYKTGDYYETNTRLMALSLQPQQTEPVWAGRFEGLEEAYAGLLGKRPVLVLVGPSGSGKSRMLRELAAMAVRGGQLPIFLDGKVDGEEINSAELLRKGLFRAYQRSGDAYGFDWSVTTQMDELGLAGEATAQLKEDVRKLWRADRELTPQVLGRALQHDLGGFAAEVQARLPGARPMVFLGRVELLPSKFAERLLSTDLFTAFGLGTKDCPVPVVLTLDGTRLNSLLAKGLLEKRRPAEWYEVLPLDPWVGAEAVGACERVLLHPHDTSLHRAAKTPWILDRERDAKAFEKRIGRLLDDYWSPAIPSGFTSKEIYRWVIEAEDDGVARAADDNDIIRELKK